MGNKVKDIGLNLSSRIKSLFDPSLLSSQDSSISLDIGSAYIKAVSLEKNNQSIFVTGFSCEKIDSDIKIVIKKTLSKLPIKKKELALSVSGHNVVLRYINMPIMSHEEVVKAMTFELEKHIPLNRNEVNFDFAILKKNKVTNKMLVIIAAAKKELVEERMTLCQELGYRPSFIDACPLAVANYFEYVKELKGENVCAVVNLGASVSSVDIIEDGQLVLSRDILVGGKDFTKKIADNLNKSLEEAEDIKLNSLSDDLASSFDSVYDSLLKELKASFDFYETQANRLVDRILITGGASQLKGLRETFKQFLGQEVELVTFKPNELRLVDSLNAGEFQSKFNFFTIALGIALRGLS